MHKHTTVANDIYTVQINIQKCETGDANLVSLLSSSQPPPANKT